MENIIGNLIVSLSVLGAAWYLYKRIRKTTHTDNACCGGCDACGSSCSIDPVQSDLTNETKKETS